MLLVKHFWNILLNYTIILIKCLKWVRKTLAGQIGKKSHQARVLPHSEQNTNTSKISALIFILVLWVNISPKRELTIKINIFFTAYKSHTNNKHKFCKHFLNFLKLLNKVDCSNYAQTATLLLSIDYVGESGVSRDTGSRGTGSGKIENIN